VQFFAGIYLIPPDVNDHGFSQQFRHYDEWDGRVVGEPDPDDIRRIDEE
jgi:hypothetical protein